MTKTLTAIAIKNLRPAAARREVRDAGCPGLYLVIQPSGHKSWALRFRRPNLQTAKLTLGPVDFSGRETDDVPKIGAPLTSPPPATSPPRFTGRDCATST